MRNLEKGQHIFIAFQNGKAVLDSQLRPRIYTILENADKWTPTVNKGKIEYVEYAPTLTPQNKWVSVDERLPDNKGEYLVAYHPCIWDFVSDEICVGFDSFRGKTTWAKKKYQRVTHWMPLPEPPEKEE